MHDETFSEMKQLVKETWVFINYNPKEDLQIWCDASSEEHSIVVLPQGKTIAYASKALSNTELTYAKIKKAMLAIVLTRKILPE